MPAAIVGKNRGRPRKNHAQPMKRPKCHVCDNKAFAEVLLFDVYLKYDDVFLERDYTCPFLCRKHVIENEDKAQGIREPRGSVTYPYSNQHGAQGFTVYRPLA